MIINRRKENAHAKNVGAEHTSEDMRDGSAALARGQAMRRAS